MKIAAIPVCLFPVTTLGMGGASRHLAYESLWKYEPETLITDNAALELDMRAIKHQLAIGTESSYELAKRIYSEGAHSRSTARLLLDDPLDRDIPKGSPAQGVAQKMLDRQRDVVGTVHSDAKKGDLVILIVYATNQFQSNYVDCQVGAKPLPNTDGCFASSGTITFPDLGANYGYSYNMTRDNINYRTIQGLSINAKAKMAECETCPKPDYYKFTQYYGKHTYGNHIVLSALNGTKTTMGNFNMDYSQFTREGRTEIAEKAMAYMNIWMWTIYEMEHAVDLCLKGCEEDDSCQETPGVHAWDTAVAYYTGAAVGQSDSAGDMLFHLAEKRCISLRTCGEDGMDTSGSAHANHMIYKHFIDGQKKLNTKDCEGARKVKERVVRWLTIPLIQGTLRYAYMISRNDKYNEKQAAEGAAHAAAVLPIVHNCSQSDAGIIAYNMRVMEGSTLDFQAVKAAFERNYVCMKIKCEEVGGIYNDLLGEYELGAQPCPASPPITRADDENLNRRSAGFAVGGVVAVAVVVLVAALLPDKHRPPRDDTSPPKPREDEIYEFT